MADFHISAVEPCVSWSYYHITQTSLTSR